MTPEVAADRLPQVPADGDAGGRILGRLLESQMPCGVDGEERIGEDEKKKVGEWKSRSEQCTCLAL